MSEYTERAERFLQENGLEFRAVLVGSDCPMFCKDAKDDKDMDQIEKFPRRSHIHGKHYRCTVSGKGRHVSFDFWNSYSDEEHNAKKRGEWGNPGYYDWDVAMKVRKEPKRTPIAYDLLACLQKCDVGSFENFCGDFGYDEDSRSAERTYDAVRDEWRKVQRFFTVQELEQLQEIQ